MYKLLIIAAIALAEPEPPPIPLPVGARVCLSVAQARHDGDEIRDGYLLDVCTGEYPNMFREE